MRILIVDSNIVYAKKVGEFLEEHVKNGTVDYAQNVPVLQRRLKAHRYDLIIADILAAFDAKAMQQILKKVEIPMVVWSVLQRPDELTRVFLSKLKKRVMEKPKTEAGLREAVSHMSPLMPAVIE